MDNSIEQLCKFAFNFSNMDTIFIDELLNKKIDYGFTRVPDQLKPYFSNLVDKLKLNDPSSDYVILFHSNSYNLNFISAKLYFDGIYLGSIILGPYLLEEPTTLMIESIILNNNMSLTLKNVVTHYYSTLPLISISKATATGEFLYYIVSTFNPEKLENFKMEKLTYDFKTEYLISPDILKKNTENSIEHLEKIYSIENSCMHAVELGNADLYQNIMRKNNFLLTGIPDRIPNDPLRSAKNYTIVLNTLFRKAAEKGGLHPIYLDSISSKYAVQIEKCTYLKQLSDLINSMQLEYCDSVNKLSLKNYSPTIRKAMEFIRINLNHSLSLNSISKILYISSYELSRQFKKETGETITDYINKKRINVAVFILENENISITDISYMVGFNDVNYFTKVFKKLKGITPSEYRKNKI